MVGAMSERPPFVRAQSVVVRMAGTGFVVWDVCLVPVMGSMLTSALP